MASHKYDWDNNQIHYRKSGMGDPILLVHGLYPGASSEEFDHNIRALSRQFRVYAIDLLGFGLSDAPRIRYRGDFYPALLGDFIQDVIGAPAGVIAAGASGPFAATLTAEHPDLVSKLVFLSPSGPSASSSSHGWLWRAGREVLRNIFLFPPLHLLFQEVMAGEWEIQEMLRRTFREKSVISSGVVARLVELARRPGVLETYASLELGLLDLPFAPVLRQISTPSLFVGGESIEVAEANELEHLSTLPQQSRLAWIEKAAHWPHYETPTATNRLIASFLSSEMAIGLMPETEAPAQRLVA
jgi:pimeloyl-ACP methyl ester carboxylesterase